MLEQTEKQEETAGREASGVDAVVMRHWYCFSYNGTNPQTGLDCAASTYAGYERQRVTKPMIDENKKHAGVNEGAVLIAVSYLGYMTREEMLGA